MTFQTIGITEDGKRILRFDHDHTRKHSPIIDKMEYVYIKENKSIAEYLRQLIKIGEDAEDYATIWKYYQGETEPRFKLHEYPELPFQVTKQISNLIIN